MMAAHSRAWRQRTTLGGALAVLLIAFGLGVWRLDTESLWHDEGWSYRAIQSPFGTPDDNTPPLYYLIQHTLQQIGFGESAFELRYGSLLLHVVGVALSYKLARRWLGLWPSYVVGVLWATSPLLWQYAQELRAYVMMPLFVVLFLWMANLLLQQRPYPAPLSSRGWRTTVAGIPFRVWFFVLGVELIALYAHNLSVPLVAWLNLVVIVVWGGRSLRGDVLSGKRLSVWLVGQVSLFLAYLPWLITQEPSGTTLNTTPRFDNVWLQDLFRGFILPVVSEPDALPRHFIFYVHIVPLFVGLAILLALWRRRNRQTLLIISQVLLLPVFSNLLLIQASIDFHPRYFIAAWPSILLLWGGALTALPHPIQRWASGFIVVVMLFISMQSLAFIADRPIYQSDDFESLARYYDTLPEDTVILIPYTDEPALTAYFDDQFDIAATFIPLPIYLSPEQAIQQLNTILTTHAPQRIELLTWFQVPADERGMYACLLSSAGQSLDTYYETVGLRSAAFRLEHPIERHPVALENGPPRFAGPLQPLEVAYIPGDQQTCLMTTWQLAESIPVAADYYAKVQVLNPLNNVLFSADSLILRDDQARTPDWQRVVNLRGNDLLGTTFTLIQLPDGAPALDYPVQVRLYAAQDPSGVDIAEPTTGAILGKDWTLPALPIPGMPFAEPPTAPQLNADNLPENRIDSGVTLEVEIINPYTDAVALTLAGQNWQMEERIPSERPSLWWSAFTIPPDADGLARLYLGEQLLAEYTVVPVAREFDPPRVETVVEAQFDDLAELFGANVRHQDEIVVVDLIWRALGNATTSYMVFVQLLDESGQLLSQSDRYPADGERPTTGWVPDEFIMDSHAVPLNNVNYRGDGMLIVGLYNPVTRERVTLSDGSSYAQLPIPLTIR